MTTTVFGYLTSPQAARVRVYISALFVAVALVICWGGPGLIVTGPWLALVWLALVALWAVVVVSAYRKAPPRRSASISAPNAALLARDARSSYRHAVEYGFPTDPWTELEACWRYEADLPLVIDPVEPPPTSDPFDLDTFVARTRERLRDAKSPTERAAIEADVDRRVAEYAATRRGESLADLANRSGATVGIVDGAGRVIATHPSSDLDVVRCSWPLSGNRVEDLAVVRTLQAHGVDVKLKETGTRRTAHLSGTHGALKAARAEYMRDHRARNTATGDL